MMTPSNLKAANRSFVSGTDPNDYESASGLWFSDDFGPGDLSSMAPQVGPSNASATDSGFGLGGLVSAAAAPSTTSTGSAASSTATTTSTASGTAKAGTTATPSWIASLSDSVLKSDMSTAAVDGTISEAEMAKLFTDLGAELTTSKSTLSASQFADLKTIVADLGVGESVSSYVTYISSALVNGNAANAKWTGGAATSVALGNLAVGSTATQLSELDGKWLLGTDSPTSTVQMSGVRTFSVSYSAVSSPLFATSGPSMSDVNQGYLGDCYLLAPLAEIAKQDPSILQSMITSNGNNTYGVRFFVNGTAEYVTVNNALANGGTEFNSGTDIWASLVEKAYAEFQASGVVTGNTVNYGNSFSTIGNGGSPEYALEEITGATSITDFNASGSSWSDAIYNSSLRYQSGVAGLSTASVMATLVSDLAKGDDLVLTSLTNATDSAGRTTLVSSHAMSIYGFDSATGMLDVRNPWGTASGQYWDTTFEVSLTTLLADGDTISVDNVGASSAPSAPVLLAQTANQTETVGKAFSFAVAAGTFIDPNNSALTYSATLANGGALPSWLQFNAATDTFSGTPTAAGTTSVTVKATDSYGLSTSETFSFVAATPAAPVLAAQTANQTESVGKAFSFTVAAGTFRDPNSSALTYSATQASGTALPSWLQFNAATDTFSGTPTAAGVTSVTLKAVDTYGLSVSETFSFTAVAPSGPVLSNQTASQTWTIGQPVSFTLAANTFSDTKAMSYSAFQLLNTGDVLATGWLRFNSATDTFSGTVASNEHGTLHLGVTAMDSTGANVTDYFNVSFKNQQGVVVSAMANDNGSAAPANPALFGGVSPLQGTAPSLALVDSTGLGNSGLSSVALLNPNNQNNQPTLLVSQA